MKWTSAPDGDERVEWLLGLGATVLDASVQRRRVPAVERRRDRPPNPRRLTIAEQREIMLLAEAHIELPPRAREVADALARAAPPPHVRSELRLSGLIEAEPLTDLDRERRGR